MICRIAELQFKELVDISTGAKYGYISDLEIDTELGSIKNIVVYGRPRIFGILGREPDLIFPWSAIKRIGSDLILLEAVDQKTPNKKHFY